MRGLQEAHEVAGLLGGVRRHLWTRWRRRPKESRGRRAAGTPASPFQDEAFRRRVTKAGGVSTAAFRCKWSDELDKKPVRFVHFRLPSVSRHGFDG